MTSGTVMTVCGPVAAEQLGHTQTHEHILCDLSWTDRRWDLVTLEDQVQMTEEVRRYGAAGGGTLVELTPREVGRKAGALREISMETGVHVVMGTSWYRAPYYPPEIERSTTARLADMLVEEIEHGAEGTGVRPGIIGEIGTDKRWMQGVEERVFRASARAHRRTGLALSTHTPPHAAKAHLDILFEEGADPAKVIVGHCDNTLELDYLLSILATGAWVQFDLIGLTTINSDERRADMLVELLRRGHLGRLLLSLDLGTRPRLSTNGGRGYAELIDFFLPMLRERGVSDEEIRTLTRDNPQRVLAL